MKFLNLSFPEIPSKSQIFKREQTRIEYFKQLMDQILYYARTQPSSLRTRLLSLLYKLLMIDAVPIKELSSEQHSANSKSPYQEDANYRTGSGHNQFEEAK